MTIPTWKELTNFSIKTVPKKSREEKFWDKVAICDNESCWEWKAATDIGGYGVFWNGFKGEQSHRTAWKLNKGPIPEGLLVLHKCDNRKCCNPNHLFTGTQPDNIKDMIKKGRHRSPKGEKNGRAKLTNLEAEEIRHLFSTGQFTQKQLRASFPVSHGTMSNVVRNKTYHS